MTKKTLCLILCAVMLLGVSSSFGASYYNYTIKSGDTMYAIATAHGVTYNELIRINTQITDPSKISVGQVIKIPTSSATPDTATGVRESLTYLYAGTTVSYLKLLDRTGGSIKTVCPDYFDIDAAGNLLISPADKIDTAFIDEMHSRGIKVTPFISNHWDKAIGNAGLNNRAALATQVAAKIIEYNLDGINIDIENVNEQYRAAYTDFTRLLRQKLPSSKVVAVAVAANPNGWKTGWHGSYDYAALASYSDYLMLMTYDESYYGGPSGPVSSSSFFEKSLKYAINQGVPASKIVAGLPFFGRYWREGATVGGNGITQNDIEYLTSSYTTELSYDKTAQSAYAKVTIKSTDPKPKLWGGSTLAAGVYHIWYDNHQSTMHKLDMIASYNLLGAGSWALGQESADVWSYYTSVLNGTYIPPAEAAPAPEPPAVPVRSTLDRILEILNKDNTRTVYASSNLTRGEAAVVLSEWTFCEPEYGGSKFFPDTANYWGIGQINALKRRGVVRGSNGIFKPNETVSREELCAMLQRVTVLPNTIDYQETSFHDVPKSRWSYNVISEFAYFSIVNGTGGGRFSPTDGMRVEHLALMLDRIAANGYPLNPDKQAENGWVEPLLEPR